MNVQKSQELTEMEKLYSTVAKTIPLSGFTLLTQENSIVGCTMAGEGFDIDVILKQGGLLDFTAKVKTYHYDHRSAIRSGYSNNLVKQAICNVN